jgi:opacity protein-like surface antigen
MIRSKKCQFLLAALMLSMAALALGQAASAQDGDSSFIHDRLQVAAHADAEQPHWIAPLFTTTPRLLEQLRFDIVTQPKKGFETTNFGGGKGLELIPFANTEILISTPPYVTHDKPGVQDGFGDMSFLLKYRVAAGNEESGNYIVTAFLGASVPTGTYSNGATSAIITPTIAAGKGWGRFDFQTTFGIALPTDHMDKLGTPLANNVAFQYRVLRKFWPEVEVNSTLWTNGSLAGDKQVFLSPGLIAGKFHLWRRLGVTVGGGVQIPVTHFHSVDRTYLASVRFPF